MHDIFDIIALLFVIASIFAYINHKVFKLPSSIGLMIAALVSSIIVTTVDYVMPGSGVSEAVRDTISGIDFSYALMNGMLSFSLFAGALHVDLDSLKERWTSISALAVVGTMISTVLIGGGSYIIFEALDVGIPLIYCMIFGALISPTDPVAVLGIMKAAKAPKDVEIKVVGESLFNDGIGVVVFAVLVAIATGGGAHGGGEAMDAMDIVTLLLQEVIGGIGIGLILGWITFQAMKSLNEPYLEMMISVGLVMGLTLLAFSLHASAPLAAVVAGLFIGNQGREHAMSDRTRETLDTIWQFVDEALNAILFLLIGFEFFIIPFDISYITVAIAAIALALAARTIAVFTAITIVRRWETFMKGTKRLLVWGGLKGGISVALALSLPPFEGRDVIITATYAVVVSSILVQGLTIGKLIKILAPSGAMEAEPADEHGAH